MTEQAPDTTAAAEIEGMSLAAVHEDTQPWAELLQGPHPPEVSRVVGALTGVLADRDRRLQVAYTLRDAGLLAWADELSLAELQQRADKLAAEVRARLAGRP